MATCADPDPGALPPPRPVLGVKEPACACAGHTDTPPTPRRGLTLFKFLQHDMLKKQER